MLHSNFIKLVALHRNFRPLIDSVTVTRETTIIRQIQKEGLRLIQNDSDFTSLLGHSDDFVQFWCAVCCVEHKHSMTEAMQKLRYIAVLDEMPSIYLRAKLILLMFDKD